MVCTQAGALPITERPFNLEMRLGLREETSGSDRLWDRGRGGCTANDVIFLPSSAHGGPMAPSVAPLVRWPTGSAVTFDISHTRTVCTQAGVLPITERPFKVAPR